MSIPLTDTYGSKRDFAKIDIYLLSRFAARSCRWQYEASTTWARTCKEAKSRFLAAHDGLSADQVRCSFAKGN